MTHVMSDNERDVKHRKCDTLQPSSLDLVVDILEHYLTDQDLVHLCLYSSQFRYIVTPILSHRKFRMLCRMQLKVVRTINIALEFMSHTPNIMMIAGSAALWLYQNQPLTWFPNDVDIFICCMTPMYTPSTPLVTENHLSIECTTEKSIGSLLNESTTDCVTHIHTILKSSKNITIQIIDLPTHRTAESIFKSF